MTKKKAQKSAQPAERNEATPTESKPAKWWRQLLDEPIAIGLAILLVLRPIIDGITYPMYNLIFLVGTAAIFMTWAVNMLRNGHPLVHGRPIALLCAFFGVALLTSFDTIQAAATYNALMIWSGYLMIFVVMTNAIRTRLGLGILMGAFLFTMGGEALFSIIHLEIILPDTRMKVSTMSALRQSFFNTSGQLDPELVYRLSVNRAFGTLLFPNALGAFLLLGIPYTALSIRPSLDSLREALNVRRAQMRAQSAEAAFSEGLTGIAYAACVWFVVFFVIYMPIAFFIMPTVAVDMTTFVSARPMTSAIWLGFLPLACAIVTLVLTKLRGISVCLNLQRAVLLPMALVFQSIALYWTYSRGAFLGLIVASVVTWFIVSRRDGKQALEAGGTSANPAMAALLVFVLLVGSWQTVNAQAQAPGPTMEAAPVSTTSPTPAPAMPAPESASAKEAQFADTVSEAEAAKQAREGYDLSARDLANPASLKLRLDYWKTGAKMLAGNPITGVGLGNYATAYPKYQDAGAAEVKMAHNDYLQILAETGLLGGLLFVGFWVVWLIDAARTIRRASNRRLQIWMAGLFCGVFAFLIHSLVDFNFYNPSLATAMFFVAGAFHAHDNVLGKGMPKGQLVRNQMAIVPVMCLVMFIAGNAVRAYRADAMSGDLQHAPAVLSTGQWFAQKANPTTFKPENPPYAPISKILALVPTRNEIDRFGLILIRESGSREATPLPANEPLGSARVLNDGIVMLKYPEAAREVARARIQEWIDIYENADSLYPYDPEVAGVLFQCYELLRNMAPTPDIRKQYALNCEEWAKAAVERSPDQAWYREYYAKALWYRAEAESTSLAAKEKYYLDGLKQYEIATQLFSTVPRFWRLYAEALREMARAYRERGDETTKAKYAELGKNARDTARKLEIEIDKINKARLGIQ